MEVRMENVKRLHEDLEAIREGHPTPTADIAHHASRMAYALNQARHCGLLDAQTLLPTPMEEARKLCREALADFNKAINRG